MEWYVMNGGGLQALTMELVVQKSEEDWELCSDVTGELLLTETFKNFHPFSTSLFPAHLARC